MKVSKVSLLTGKLNVMELNVTTEQLFEYQNTKKLVQNIFPHLTPGEREFLISGITPEEWENEFGKLE